ncbi:hypothetical protein HMPREF3191_01609 [Veillonellaceae bacterium DNF00626]|nr:hypothetical protein HMPREF3191_01609 [Veillonellaceae bacterium DNF00626]
MCINFYIINYTLQLNYQSIYHQFLRIFRIQEIIVILFLSFSSYFLYLKIKLIIP